MSESSSLRARFDTAVKLVLVNNTASLRDFLADSDQTDVLCFFDRSWSTLLCLATSKNFVDIAKVLLQAKANVNQRGPNERTALVVAAQRGHDQMVSLLLEQPAVLALDLEDQWHRSALAYAIRNSSRSIVQRLLDARATVENCEVYPGVRGDTEIVKLLLQHKADVDGVSAFGCGNLHRAARRGHNAVVSLLLKANATVDLVDKNGHTPLIEAASGKNVCTVRLILTAGADVNHRAVSWTALHYASAKGRAAIVEELLRAGADPNARATTGQTPLMVASKSCIVADTLRLLLNAKADVNQVDAHGDTALIRAVARRNASAAFALLQNGADWLKKGKASARQHARWKEADIQNLFHCTLCGWEGMCCAECRKKYCVFECDKFSDPFTEPTITTLDCRSHRRLAHQAILEWTLAMSSLELPPYVVEIIFESLHLNSTEQDYQNRKGFAFLWIPENKASLCIDDNFVVHLILEERTHLENINLFIAVHKAFQNRVNKQS